MSKRYEISVGRNSRIYPPNLLRDELLAEDKKRKNRRIPKWFAEQYKSLTGLDPLYRDYQENVRFHPRSQFERNPVASIVVLAILAIVIVWGVSKVFFN